MRNFKLKIIALALVLCGISSQSFAQDYDVDNDFQYRLGLDFSWTLVKNLKLSIEPQFRIEDPFDFERFQVEAGLKYKTFGFLYWGAQYRVMFEPGGNNFGQYAFNITAKEDFGRFTPSVRVQYSNYTNSSITDKEFMRYKAAVEYNIRKSPFTPYASVEVFHSLDVNLLYKTRYSAGFDLKVKKDRYLNFDYGFEYYALDYKNRHIFSIGYKFKF